MKLGKYKHFKGNVYEVIAVAKHTEKEEELVIYERKGRVWARPKLMFLENIVQSEYKGPRFTYMGD